MKEAHPILHWIDDQFPSMPPLLKEWAEINSSSDNLDGLSKMLQALKQQFSLLNGTITEITLPPQKSIDAKGNKIEIHFGKALHIVKRPTAPIRIFFGGHMDTVYPVAHPFQKTEQKDNILQGPGVADMKGGLLIMYTALKAFENSPLAQNIGWEILINPDEEIGSIGSESLLIECSKRNNLGLIFEPAYPDGSLVGSRKGSTNMTVIARGKAAHAGRDFEKGSNAITALAKFAVEAEKLNDQKKGLSINVGHFQGGGPVNVVPDFALCCINVRSHTQEDLEKVQQQLTRLIEHSKTPGVSLELHLLTTRAPKLFDTNSQTLFEQLKKCAEEEGHSLKYQSSGGVCDGNILAAYGMPVIDTLGVIGGDIHSSNEYVLLDSLRTRTRLVTTLLLKLASGIYQVPGRSA